MSSPAKILVIEDNPADIAILRYGLDRLGERYELDVLENGERALEFVQEHRSGKRAPDPCVIVLDLHLPRYDGLAILREIRRTPDLKHIQVVVLSSLASPAEEREIGTLGGQYITKPANLQAGLELAENVMMICRSFAHA